MEDAVPQVCAFDRLPSNVIEHILYAADANVFASLALLNRQWRRISESPSLYAHHLSRCPSFAWSTRDTPAPGEADSLLGLKRKFIEEIRRNAFDVFLRPHRTLVHLISSSMSSSTAFPQGEVFRFSFSANGQLVLCISSSRIVVLDVTTDPVSVKHELKTRRRPMGAAIQDDGKLLAVLSSTHRVNIYRLSREDANHIQMITLNDAPRDLTFSPTGSVLALSFADSIEVYAVGEEVLSTERRAARCLRLDALSFSSDGSMLLGSSIDQEEDGIVTITAPFYTEPGIDASPEEVQMRMWTTQILFPESTHGFTHACLIAEHDEADDSWLLGHDSQLAAFRAIKASNPTTSGVYFASPFLREELREKQPIMLPATDDAGELAALGFQDSEIYIYGVPKRLDMAPSESNPGTAATSDTCFAGNDHNRGQVAPRDNLAQLEKIVQQPKVLIRGRQVTDMHGITSARWVHSAQQIKPRRRLVAVAPGGVRPQIIGEEDVPVDGGRMLLLDFQRSATNGQESEIDIEVGETAPKMLTEPDSSLDTEVELERRRTRLIRGDIDFTTALAHRPFRPVTQASLQSSSQTALPQAYRNSIAGPISPDANSPTDIPETPYDNTQPRSHDTLSRAATAAALTRGRYDPRFRSTSPRQVPQESDADNWAPPPPYRREPDEHLPGVLQQTLQPTVPATANQTIESLDQPVQNAQTLRVARPNPADQTRPQSAILHRLSTITGRIGRREFLATGGNSNQEPAIPPVPQPSRQLLTTPLRPSTANPIIPVATGYLPSAQPLPVLAVHPAERFTQPHALAIPTLEASMLGDNYFPYSVSSPNLLHIPQPHGNALDLAAEDEALISERQRSFRRRVSTEPTSLPPPENAEWRRRIEDWNEHTIRERSRKRRNKCILM
ncbi:uncharacterized protein N7459_008729 [Penicillium hispanicum]|uniref:uncharacterized protein n=1 Tax=Penicillium hispanicum TaxID=1080232 RepID=UPI002540A3ED|nr:uncharacterized protein N7459_008729 [Penicillium hispanicum]KAJ5574302.1 hypothetical protein N7459_008729 [Penicillium hispanicum]